MKKEETYENINVFDEVFVECSVDTPAEIKQYIIDHYTADISHGEGFAVSASRLIEQSEAFQREDPQHLSHASILDQFHSFLKVVLEKIAPNTEVILFN